MIALGLIGRPDVAECHDATACLLVDGRVTGVLEQERVSRRRFAPGEGPDAAASLLLAAHGLQPEDIDVIGYAWADAAQDSPLLPGSDFPAGVRVSAALTDVILPTVGPRLRNRDILFFDHHLSHAAQVYWMNPHERADILVADGMGGAGSTSLFQVSSGKFTLLERYSHDWSLGIFYEAAGYHAGLGWDAAGKLMGLSSYGRPSGRRFFTFDDARGTFTLAPDLSGLPPGGLREDGLAHIWTAVFAASCFPYATANGNTFDYATFAADVQQTLEDAGLGLATRLHRLSGEDVLLLAGGVALNAHLNRRLCAEGPYPLVSGSSAPHDGGAAMGAGLLAAAAAGEPLRPWSVTDAAPIFIGPEPGEGQVDAAVAGLAAGRFDRQAITRTVAHELSLGRIVAYFDGPSEVGPRALGARSLLASPVSRTMLARLNTIKSRAPWRPAALSLTLDGFEALSVESPRSGLTEFMLCAHQVAPDAWRKVPAGVHVDGTTRAQLVPAGTSFADVIDAFAAETGIPAVVNTSLNLRGEPMVLTPRDAVRLFTSAPDVDVLVMPPYVLRRTG